MEEEKKFSHHMNNLQLKIENKFAFNLHHQFYYILPLTLTQIISSNINSGLDTANISERFMIPFNKSKKFNKSVPGGDVRKVRNTRENQQNLIFSYDSQMLPVTTIGVCFEVPYPETVRILSSTKVSVTSSIN